ncbi:MAG: hypothetical protein HQL46_08710 [Gammaproteobacteria bacterium]|nr:hypothetical protein [Gammaproteobacteria bacterium]
MSRLIYIVAILLLIWFAFRYFRTQMKAQENNKQKKKSVAIKDVKPCALCGLHIPVDEMVTKNKLSFCCYQHMQEYQDKRQNKQ